MHVDQLAAWNVNGRPSLCGPAMSGRLDLAAGIGSSSPWAQQRAILGYDILEYSWTGVLHGNFSNVKKLKKETSWGTRFRLGRMQKQNIKTSTFLCMMRWYFIQINIEVYHKIVILNFFFCIYALSNGTFRGHMTTTFQVQKATLWLKERRNKIFFTSNQKEESVT